jgi:hypothetical protein
MYGRHLVNNKQTLLVGAWILVLSVVTVGPLLLSSGEFLILLVAAALVVSLFKNQITPKTGSPPSPLQIFERSPFWRGLALVYGAVVVIVIVWHLFVAHIAFFDNVSLPLLLVLILGPAIGPITINLVITYKMLGAE